MRVIVGPAQLALVSKTLQILLLTLLADRAVFVAFYMATATGSTASKSAIASQHPA